jgi:hypothetical protein
MLTKDDLLALDYEILPDPDQPGQFCWRNAGNGTCDTGFDTEARAIEAAAAEAMEAYALHRCDDCGRVHSDETLVPAQRLSERVGPGGPTPSGECPDCGALCYPIEPDPDWGTVMGYFGLDDSFCWTDTQVADYTRQYLESVAEKNRKVALGERAITLLEELDSYLREIRAENLDGSEPALGTLLDQTAAFWTALGKR